MKTAERQLKGFVAAISVTATLAGLGAIYLFPPSITGPWILAFVTLLALAVLGAVLAITVTEGGATTAMEFIAQLGAIVLLGPAGAIFLTILTQLLSEFLILRKPPTKAIFNLAQTLLAVALAGVLYVTFGGQVSLETMDFRGSFPPFLVSVLGYFAVNTAAVAYAIAILERRSPIDVWRQSTAPVIVFDVVMSSLAYVVAFLYVRWGPVALLSAIVPIIGLRYTYGVNIRLQNLNQDLLRVLIKTLEARDQYTSGHSVRVAQYARRIAEALALRRSKIQQIESGALLHDIGKIDLAYGEILRQAGPLTPAQRELIRAHPDKGVEILSSVRSIDRVILECVRHHHEWFDGTGYPVGLAGEEIPIGARIIMISDSVDAMMTDRPYRRALNPDEVRKELLRNSGSQFDPTVVEAALTAGILDSEREAVVTGATSASDPLPA